MDSSPSPMSNPWLEKEKPTSEEQFSLLVNLRCFKNIRRDCHPGTSYPYRLNHDAPDMIPFFELLGCGPPPNDVAGNPGDIYVDVTALTLYFRGNHLWQCWNKPVVDSEPKYMPLPQHPIFHDRYLACPSRGFCNVPCLSWYPAKTIKKTWNISVKHNVDPATVIAEVYEGLYNVSADKKISLTNKWRKRRSSVGDPVVPMTTVPHQNLVLKFSAYSHKKPKTTSNLDTQAHEGMLSFHTILMSPLNCNFLQSQYTFLLIAGYLSTRTTLSSHQIHRFFLAGHPVTRTMLMLNPGVAI
jgi:hypothetical protein